MIKFSSNEQELQKNPTTIRDCQGGNINHKSLFLLSDLSCSILMKSKQRLVVYITIPVISSCFLAFSSLFEFIMILIQKYKQCRPQPQAEQAACLGPHGLGGLTAPKRGPFKLQIALSKNIYVYSNCYTKHLQIKARIVQCQLSCKTAATIAQRMQLATTTLKIEIL